jgi:hypothetical protein
MRFTDIDAFPGHDGEILVSAIRGDFCFEVTVEPDLTLTVAFERGDDFIFAIDKLSIEKAKEKLFEAGRVYGFLPLASSSSIRYESWKELL